MKYFYFVGFGSFSHDYGWDSGCTYMFTEEGTEKEFNAEPPSWVSDVREVWFNEHGGNRSSDLLVRAESLGEAVEKARDFAELYYPQK